MKAITLGCNIVFFIFTLFIMMTDGPPVGVFYVIFTLLLLLTPPLSCLVIAKNRIRVDLTLNKECYAKQRNSFEVHMSMIMPETGAAILNLLMLGTSLWILIDQYPHPIETGFYIYAVLLLLTPVLNLLNFTSTLARKSCLRNLKM